MPGKDADTRLRILETTVEILNEGTDPKDVTVRYIADRAQVGVGLINYHFRTKEKLMFEAVMSAMSELASTLTASSQRMARKPRDRLKRMLKETAHFGLRYPNFLKVAVEHEVLHGEFTTAQMIVPLLKEIFGDKRDDRTLKLMALQIVGPIQIAFLRAEAMRRYAGIDPADEKQRDLAIDTMVDNVIRANG